MSKIPFSVYDFFGYLASGFLFLVSVDFAFGLGWLPSENIPMSLGFIFLIVCYITGHTLSLISKLVFETGILKKTSNLPENILLKKNFQKRKWMIPFPEYFIPLPPRNYR